MTPTQIFSYLLWIGLCLGFILSKKHFVMQESALTKKVKIFLIIISLIVFLFNALVLGNAYYKAYNPNYEYESVKNTVGFHIYKPTSLPTGIEQTSKFYIYDKDFFGSTQAVRAVYDIPLKETVKGIPSVLTIITQAKVQPSFNIEQSILLSSKGETAPKIEKVTLSNFSNDQTYIQTGGVAKIVYIVTSDNVLISIASPKETQENLMIIANSLK